MSCVRLEHCDEFLKESFQKFKKTEEVMYSTDLDYLDFQAPPNSFSSPTRNARFVFQRVSDFGDEEPELTGEQIQREQVR
jgi:hypothetical protein